MYELLCLSLRTFLWRLFCVCFVLFCFSLVLSLFIPFCNRYGICECVPYPKKYFCFPAARKRKKNAHGNIWGRDGGKPRGGASFHFHILKKNKKGIVEIFDGLNFIWTRQFNDHPTFDNNENHFYIT